MLFQKPRIVLRSDTLEQCTHGGANIADKPKIHGGAAANVFRILIYLDFLHALARQKFGERKVGAEQQKKISVVDRAVCSAVSEQAGHANGIGIVVSQPLLAAERVSDRRF